MRALFTEADEQHLMSLGKNEECTQFYEAWLDLTIRGTALARRAFTVNVEALEADKQRLQEEADRLRADCARLQGELAVANDTLAKERADYKDRRHKREKRHKEEVAKLKAHAESLDRQLKSYNQSLTECALKIEELHAQARTIADEAVKK